MHRFYLLVSSLGSFLKNAVIWFVTKNGIQGIVEYNACLQCESAYHSMISSFRFKYAGKRVPEIQEVSITQFSYEWFGLGFTGVPADSAALSTSPMFWHSLWHRYFLSNYRRDDVGFGAFRDNKGRFYLCIVDIPLTLIKFINFATSRILSYLICRNFVGRNFRLAILFVVRNFCHFKK